MAKPSSSASLLLSPAALVFVGTGVASTLIAQALVNAGAAAAWTFLPAFANYAGMAACALLPDSALGLPSRDRSASGGDGAPSSARASRARHMGTDVESSGGRGGGGGGTRDGAAPSGRGCCTLTVPRFVAATVLLDCAGYTLSIYALALAGSSLFQVLYSSVVVWAALGSWAVRGTALSWAQVAGIALVLCGLAASSAAERAGGSGGGGGGAGGSGASASPAVLLGMALSVACAMTYGCVYVLAEAVVALERAPGPRVLASRVGVAITAVLGAYIAVAVVPRLGDVAASMRAAGAGPLSTPAAAGAAYAALALCSAAHSVTYYTLVGRSGAVSTGVMSALRAVGVALASAALFCGGGDDGGGGGGGHAAHRAAAQCLTPLRAACGAVVVGGVLLYSAAAPRGGGHAAVTSAGVVARRDGSPY